MLHLLRLSAMIAVLSVALSCSHAVPERHAIDEGSFDLDFDSVAVAVGSTGESTVDEVGFALGFLAPDSSMAVLRSVVADGVLIEPEFPLVADVGTWAVAAWEIYCVTGSKEWLEEAYSVVKESVRKQWVAFRSREGTLLCGQSGLVSDWEEYYPHWMMPMDRYQTVAANVNVSYACAFRVASRMAAELRRKAEWDHQLAFSNLRSAINDRLWMPDRQYYGQYLYGKYYPVLSSVSDSRANALCVLGGIATPEMSEALVANMPVVSEGVPMVYPRIGEADRFDASVQALYALAAARVRNPQAFEHGASALINHNVGKEVSAQWVALVCKGLFGMEFRPEGIAFSPMVPSAFNGDKVLRGLRYRDAVLDISLRGSGDRVASFMIDSVAVENMLVPRSIVGRHLVEITLSSNELSERGTGERDAASVPEVPDVKWSADGLTADIGDARKNLMYEICLDGVVRQLVEGGYYRLSGKQPAVAAIVPVENADLRGFSPREHVYAPGKSKTVISASSITPRRPPLHFIKDRSTASDYIELAARHNTRITCYANVPVAGDYFLTVGYSNGSPRCAVRSLAVNDEDVATLFFPSLCQNDWITVYPSNTVVVRLVAGPNKIALTYVGGTILFNKLTLLRKDD